jgi:hypothetical protein
MEKYIEHCEEQINQNNEAIVKLTRVLVTTTCERIRDLINDDINHLIKLNLSYAENIRFATPKH